MKRAFSLVSPERQKVENINWKLCFRCQIDLPSKQVVYPFKRKGMIHNVYYIVLRNSSKETPLPLPSPIRMSISPQDEAQRLNKSPDALSRKYGIYITMHGIEIVPCWGTYVSAVIVCS